MGYGSMNLYQTASPETEITEWISGIRYVPDSLVVCMGAGDGRHIEALLNVMSPADKLIIIEPEDSVWDGFMQTSVVSSTFYRVKDWSDFRSLFLLIGDWNYLITAVIPAYEKKYSQFWKEFSTRLDKELNNLQADQSTTVYFAPRWQENLLRNIPLIAKSGCANGIKVPPGTPAILVGAGPSLHDSLTLLDSVKGKALICATQTTNRVFEQRQIKPDLIFSFDGGYQNYYEHFQGVHLDVPLVYDPVVYHKAVETWKGPLSTLVVHHTNLWLKTELGWDIMECNVGPSISNTMLDFAVRVGCDPIILIGQDLAFTHGRFHLKGTHKADLWDGGIPPELEKRIVRGVDGEDLVSTSSMMTFLHWFEEIMRSGMYSDKTFINCSGGAYIEGMKHASFDFTLREHARHSVDLAPFIDQITQPVARSDYRDYFRTVQKDLFELKTVLKRGIEHCRRLASGGDRKDLFGKMGEVDRQITEKAKSLIPIHYMVRAKIELIDRAAGQDREIEFGKVLSDTKKRYKGLLESIEFCLPFLDELT